MKLNKRIIRELIIEEVSIANNRVIWEQKRQKISVIRRKLIRRGYNPKRIDENIGGVLSGLFARGTGLGASEFVDAESEGAFFGDGGLTSGIRVAIEQTILEKIVNAVGLDPYTGFGLILKNALERVVRQYSQDQLAQLFSGDGCQDIATDIAREVLVIIEESSKERVLKLAIDSIGGQLGQDFQNSSFFKPIYQGMREKFSSAFDDVIDEEKYAVQLGTLICKHMNVSSIFGTATDFAKDELGDAFSEFGTMFSDAMPSFGNE